MMKIKCSRCSVVETAVTPKALHIPVYSRGSIDIEAAFALNVKHQVASIQVLHYKEEVLLCKQHITVSSLSDTKEPMERVRLRETIFR